jgi:hypothetical protein
MVVYYVDADELDGIAHATTNARNDLYWSLRPLEAGGWAVPWQRDTQGQWNEIRSLINRELGWMDGDARSVRDRAHRVRIAAAERVLSDALGLIHYYMSRSATETIRLVRDIAMTPVRVYGATTLAAQAMTTHIRTFFTNAYGEVSMWVAQNYMTLVSGALFFFAAVFPAVALPIIAGVLGLAAWSALNTIAAAFKSSKSPTEMTTPLPNLRAAPVISDEIREERVPEAYHKSQTFIGRRVGTGECTEFVRLMVKDAYGYDLPFTKGGPLQEWVAREEGVVKPDHIFQDSGLWLQIKREDVGAHGGFKPGDIIILQDQGARDKQFDSRGHIGVVSRVENGTISYLDQNAPRGSAVSMHDIEAGRSEIKGVFRATR